MKRNTKQFILQIVMLFSTMVGLLVLFYPFYVSGLNEYLDQVRSEAYIKANEKEMARKRQAFAEKNATLTAAGLAPGVDPFESFEESEEVKFEKEHLIGHVELPSLGKKIPLYDTTTNALLEIGATVLAGTSYPLGGASTHAVITGHRGLPNRELFTNLPKLVVGDLFLLEVLGETLAYEVFDRQVVLPHETSGLQIVPGEDYVTLVTCTPYMVNTHRLLVTGKRVPYTPAVEKIQQQGSQKRSWHRIGLTLAALVVSGSLLWLLYRVIVTYLVRRQRFDLQLQIEQLPKNSQVLLYSQNGKRKVIREGKQLSATASATGEVFFSQIPGGVYRLKVADTWLLTAGIKKRKQQPKIYKIQKKKVEKVTNQTVCYKKV